VIDRIRSGVEGVLVGRGVLRNPWILAQAMDLAAGRTPRVVTLEDRGKFLLEYIDLLMKERVDEARELTHERWVVNKLRALGSWYTKGLENGSHLRTGINAAPSLARLREIITEFFGVGLTTRLPTDDFVLTTRD
jgi:tRNA-dihydrouridine synthase